MDLFRNGTDKNWLRNRIFVFFSTCKRSQQQIAAVQLNYRGLSGLPFSKKTTCKRSCTCFQWLSSTVPFSVGYINTEFERVNRRFHLEPVLVSNRAILSLLTRKRAFFLSRSKNEQECIIRFKNSRLRIKFLNLIIHSCSFF